MSLFPLVQLCLLSTGAFFVALLLASIPRLSAACRHLIWQASFAVVTACSLFILLGIQIPLPVLRAAPSIATSTRVDPTPAAVQINIPAGSVESGSAITGSPSIAPRSQWPILIWSVWAVGVLISAIRLVRGYGTLHAVKRRSRFIGFASAKGDFSADAKTGIPVYASREIGSPMTVGIRSSVILIPERLLAESKACLKVVLLHEVAHARLFDVGFLFLSGIVTTLHWFNPLAWFASAQLKASAELAADDAALCSSTSAEEYADGLLAVIRLIKASDSRLFPTVPMAGGADVTARVARLLDANLDRSMPSRTHRGFVFSLVLVCGVALIAFRPVAAESDATNSAVVPTPVPASTHIRSESAPSPVPDVPQIEIEFKLLEFENDIYSQNRETFEKALKSSSDESFQEFLRFVSKVKGVDLLSAPKVTTRSGQRATVQIIREFRYPIEFSYPSEFDERGTPTAFETKDLGITFEVEPKLIDDKTIISGTLRVIDFLGFVDDESKTPSFQTREARVYRTLSKGEVALMLVPWQPREMGLAAKFADPNQTLSMDEPGRRLMFILKANKVPAEIRLAEEEGEKHLTKLLEETRLRERIYDQAPVTAVVDGLLNEVKEADGDRVAITWDVFIVGEVPKVTLNTKGKTTKQTLEEIEKQTDLGYHLAGSMLYFRSREKLSERKNVARNSPAYGTVVSEKPGFVLSPYSPESGYVDVRSYPPGTSVKCPYTGKLFLVP